MSKKVKERMYRVTYLTQSGKSYKGNHAFKNEKEGEKWVKSKGKMKSFGVKFLGWN